MHVYAGMFMHTQRAHTFTHRHTHIKNRVLSSESDMIFQHHIFKVQKRSVNWDQRKWKKIDIVVLHSFKEVKPQKEKQEKYKNIQL